MTLAKDRVALPLGLRASDDGKGNWTIARSDGSTLSVADVKMLANALSRPSQAWRSAAERCAYLLDLRADENDTAGLEAANTMRALLAAEVAP